MPERIQRKRSRGWRMPPGTVTITRPGRWGNPFRVTSTLSAADSVQLFEAAIATKDPRVPTVEEIQEALRGKDLACWCPLYLPNGALSPCHGTVLLRIANSVI